MIDKYIEAVRTALVHRNWYAALSLALVLPEICGKIEKPNGKSKETYEKWFDTYVAPKYARRTPLGPHQFLSGTDCYALRCAFLHEGTDNLTRQRARKALHRFRFVAPRAGYFVHLNQTGTTLQVQVDVFCNDICNGVLQWVEENARQTRIQEEMKKLLVVEDVSDTLRI